MHISTLIRLIWLIFPITTFASDLTACANSCQTPLSYLLFDGSPASAGYYTLTCTNLLLVESTFLCMRYYCSEIEIIKGLAYLDSTCQTYGAVEILPWSIIDNITDGQALAWPHIEYADLYGPVPYDTPVFVSDELYILSLRTNLDWDDSLVTRANYGYALFGFFGIVVLMGMINRGAHFISGLLNRKPLPATIRAAQAVMKAYISLPALFSHQTAEPGICGIIPPRLQSLTVICFVAINVILCCVRYQAFSGNLYWSTPQLQVWRYVSDRTGVLAMSNLPLIWAFAMRNNLLMSLTGWSFSTFNIFHRWVARVATIEAIVHSIGYTVFSFLEGGKAEYDADWKEQYWWMGVIATIVMSLLCVFSFYPIRRYTYEFFLLLHIAFAVLFLISMWYHVAIFAGEYNVFIWPCVAVWCFDRAIRIGRLVFLNLPSFRATATYNQDANSIRLTIPTRSLLRPRPGTYYYVYLLRGIKLWESHPFTLASWSSKQLANGSNIQDLAFMVRPYNGFTARLRDHILQKGEEINGHISKLSVRMAIEGPYGTPYDLSKYSSILFIIGGSGITVALSHLQALLESLKESQNKEKHSGVHSIRLVWAIRGAALFDDVFQQDLLEWRTPSSLTRQVDFRMDVHNTGAAMPATQLNGQIESKEGNEIDSVVPLSSKEGEAIDSGSPVSEISADFNKDSGGHLSGANRIAQIFSHRPRVHDLIMECAEEWHARHEKMAVVCCGPGTMVDDARAAVVAAVGKGYDEINFHPEMFHW